MTKTQPPVVTIEGVEYVPRQHTPPDSPAWVFDVNGDAVIVRTRDAGVFAGWLSVKIPRDSTDGPLRVWHARRLWYWSGAASLSELANRGVSRPESCKFPEVVPFVDLFGVIEVLPLSEAAQQSIAAVPVWSEHE